MLPQHPLLLPVDIPQPDIHQLRHADPMLFAQPAKHLLLILHRQARKEAQRHPVHVPARRTLGRVYVRVRVDPDDGHLALAAEAFADRFRRARDRADGDRVVAAEGEDEPALARVLVDLGAECAVDGADGAGPLHVAVVWVVRVEVVVVRVDLAVVGDVVVEIVLELADQAGFDEGVWSSVDAWLGL